MELREVLYERRSERKYTGETVDGEKLRRILEAGLLAPSSRNLKPCTLHVVRDRELLGALAGAKQAGGAFLADADAAVVVSGDAGRADTWIEDCSIAMTCMHLAAADLGVGSCWIQIRLRKDGAGRDAEENVRRLLGLPEEQRIVGILALGIPEAGPERKRKAPEWDRVRGFSLPEEE